MASFDKKQSISSINKLFKQLWPIMQGVGESHRDCLLHVCRRTRLPLPTIEDLVLWAAIHRTVEMPAI